MRILKPQEGKNYLSRTLQVLLKLFVACCTIHTGKPAVRRKNPTTQHGKLVSATEWGHLAFPCRNGEWIPALSTSFILGMTTIKGQQDTVDSYQVTKLERYLHKNQNVLQALGCTSTRNTVIYASCFAIESDRGLCHL